MRGDRGPTAALIRAGAPAAGMASVFGVGMGAGVWLFLGVMGSPQAAAHNGVLDPAQWASAMAAFGSCAMGVVAGAARVCPEPGERLLFLSRPFSRWRALGGLLTPAIVIWLALVAALAAAGWASTGQALLDWGVAAAFVLGVASGLGAGAVAQGQAEGIGLGLTLAAVWWMLPVSLAGAGGVHSTWDVWDASLKLSSVGAGIVGAWMWGRWAPLRTGRAGLRVTALSAGLMAVNTLALVWLFGSLQGGL